MITGRGVAALAAAGTLAAGCVAPAPTAAPAGARTGPLPPAAAFDATVDRVVDGDTLVARRPDGRRVRVRLIGIDAPELPRDGRAAECWAGEASAALDALVGDARVRAAYEPGGNRDRFGRELWDVWLTDGRFVQAELVAAGAVRPYPIRPQTAYAGLLAAAGRRAAAARAGLHGACPAD